MTVEADIVSRRGGKACFVRIWPDPVVFTYGLGMSFLELIQHAGDAAAKVEIPPERLRPDMLRR